MRDQGRGACEVRPALGRLDSNDLAAVPVAVGRGGSFEIGGRIPVEEAIGILGIGARGERAALVLVLDQGVALAVEIPHREPARAEGVLALIGVPDLDRGSHAPARHARGVVADLHGRRPVDPDPHARRVLDLGVEAVDLDAHVRRRPGRGSVDAERRGIPAGTLRGAALEPDVPEPRVQVVAVVPGVRDGDVLQIELSGGSAVVSLDPDPDPAHAGDQAILDGRAHEDLLQLDAGVDPGPRRAAPDVDALDHDALLRSGRVRVHDRGADLGRRVGRERVAAAGVRALAPQRAERRNPDGLRPEQDVGVRGEPDFAASLGAGLVQRRLHPGHGKRVVHPVHDAGQRRRRDEGHERGGEEHQPEARSQSGPSFQKVA